MLFINPPFGNYFSLTNTISIKGSYTLKPRSGLFKQIWSTLYYDPKYNGWINKIGLRNKGIDYAVQHYDGNHIVSIAIMETSEVEIIKNKIPENMNIELNVSCPNTDKALIHEQLNTFLNHKRKWCIIKLSPLTEMELIDTYYKQGFRQFHCSNTLPVTNGGLSGPSLQKYTLPLIKSIRMKYPNTIIIGGGGIRHIEDIYKYKKAGADHFSISSLLFNPLSFISFYVQYLYINQNMYHPK